MKNIWIVMMTALLFSACQQKQKEQTQAAIKTVIATKVKPARSEKTRAFTAVATTDEQAKLSFQVKGNIIALPHRVGQKIEKNELVAKLDAKAYKLQVSQLRYALKEAKAGLRNYKNSYERTKELYVHQNASASDFDKAKAAYESALSKVENMTKKLDYAGLQLSYTKLYAPMSGYVAQKFVREDENVNAGTPVVLLGRSPADEVTVQMPQKHINKLTPGRSVRVEFDTMPEKSFVAAVDTIAKHAGGKAKTYPVTLKLQSPEPAIKPGMSAKAFFTWKQPKQTFYLPASSVLQDKNGHFIYGLTQQGANYEIKKQYVQTGTLSAEGYEVTSSLQSGQLVVKAGMTKVHDGMSVSVANASALGL